MGKVKILIICVLMFGFNNANAQPLTAKVLRVGCHVTNNQCFVFVDKAIPNTGECKHKSSLRYDSETVHNSEELYSSLVAAQASGRSVMFGAAGNTCTNNSSNSFTSFTWFSI